MYIYIKQNNNIELYSTDLSIPYHTHSLQRATYPDDTIYLLPSYYYYYYPYKHQLQLITVSVNPIKLLSCDFPIFSYKYQRISRLTRPNRAKRNLKSNIKTDLTIETEKKENETNVLNPKGKPYPNLKKKPNQNYNQTLVQQKF